jgi:D-serine deaminase-like pyridoxal phosphate-dependent protein
VIPLLVAVDCRVQALFAAAQAAGSRIGVLIDVDTGMNRCGVRSGGGAGIAA